MFPMLTALQWEDFLRARFGRPVEVAYGRARTAPVQMADDGRVLRVRLHRFFGHASEDVCEDLAQWLRSGRRARHASRRLDAWIDARLDELAPARPRRVRLHPEGDVHHLIPLADSLFASEFVLDFHAKPRPAVTWGRRTRSRARRSLQLGSFEPSRNVVRVHPVLDQRNVPAWFVRYVLFHEILHAALPQLDHGPEFRARERLYPDFTRAQRWQRARIRGLIRAARRVGGEGGRVPRQGWLF